MKQRGLKFLSLLLTLVLLVGLVPGMSLTAYAISDISGTRIAVVDSDSGTVSSDMTCTRFEVFDNSTLTINQGVTLTLNNPSRFEFTGNSKIELHGTLTGSAGSRVYWGHRSYINVYLSDGAKYTVTGLSCNDGDNYLVYYGYDAATDGNGTVSVKNGSTDVTSTSTGYKTTTYTFTATPNSGYKFKNWTKGPGGEVLGTGASINVTCEQNGQYQVYANFEADAAPTYTVTYDANGGSGTMPSWSGNAGTEIEIDICSFTPPEGKEFDKWLCVERNTTYNPGQKITVDQNLTLKAQWKDEEKPDGGEKKTSGSGSGFDLVFNIPGEDNSWEYVGGGYAPQQAYRVSLAPMQGGSAALGLTTGESTETAMNVYPTTTVYVFPNAEQGYVLDKIVWSLIDGSASYDITEAKNFVMPAMDVVVYVTFRPVG